ncbi:MAG: zinc-binding dehydrogenase [Phenylobacterium sp.]|uniref:quinone oxidoreductase family protein n=1 Tax=Phenylobacterium sp. TaxID=1871053 RepID=UPI002735BBE0|nr:zinc-binding dehydrogenase [Phenylobacterium sp.]MDP3174120.1 zinc-binding dehydrogenase [Phenylobacterium sp.]
MKAAYLNSPGGPEVIVYGDLPDPVPGPGQVLVRMRATTVNHVDTIWRSGIRPYFKIVAPHVLGIELAGEIAGLGEGVTSFKIGDRVVGRPTTGAYAELAVADVSEVVKLPDTVSFEDGAGLGTTGPIAWRAVVRVAQVRAGEAVLITAAASGTGSVMVQIAKAAGAFVIGTAGGQRKLDVVRSVGADAVIDHYEEDVAARIKEITDGRGIDAAIDATCSAPLVNAVIEGLRPGGRLAIYGNMASPELTLNVRNTFFKGVKVMGVQGGDPAQVEAEREGDLIGMLRLAADGKIKLVKDKIMPLSDAAEAHRLMESHASGGKLILTS